MKEPNGVVYKGNGNWSDVSNWKGGELPHTQQLPKRIRNSIKLMIEDGISPFSIVSAHGGLVTPDEAELLREYENSLPTTETKGNNE